MEGEALKQDSVGVWAETTVRNMGGRENFNFKYNSELCF